MSNLQVNKDPKNYNKHTEEGMQLLKKSVDRFGLIDIAGVISNDNVLISGNARNEIIQDKDFEKQVIEIDGNQAVYLRLKDIKSGTEQFKEIALVSNQVAKKNINLDEEFVIEDLGEEMSLEWGIFDISEPDDLIAEKKDNLPTMKITFSSTKQINEFEKKLKEILMDFEGIYYSVSQGEM